MKVLIDLTYLADNFSGIERYGASISSQLIQNHPEIDYLLLFKESVPAIFKDSVTKKNVQYQVLKRKNKLFFNQFVLCNAVHKIKADWYLFLAFPEPIFQRKKNMISAIHDIGCWDVPQAMTWKSRLYFRVSFKRVAKRSRYIITVSQFSKNRIADFLKYPSDRIIVANSAVDQKKFSPAVLTENISEKYHLPRKYFLSLSTLEPRKNFSLLLKAFVSLCQEGFPIPDLVLVGRKGWKVDNLFEGIPEEIKKKIHTTGFVADEDLPTIYSGAQFFCFPSLYEGFGLPPLEAMSCGCPVLSSDSSSLPEVLGSSAMFFKNNDLPDLIEKLKQISQLDPQAKEKMIASGYEQAKKYNWKDSSENIASFFYKNDSSTK